MYTITAVLSHSFIENVNSRYLTLSAKKIHQTLLIAQHQCSCILTSLIMNLLLAFSYFTVSGNVFVYICLLHDNLARLMRIATEGPELSVVDVF